MSSTRVANTVALALLMALLLFGTFSHAQRSGGASLRVHVTVVKMLSSAGRSAAACLPLGGAYLTLNESALAADCPADSTVAGEPPVLMIRVGLPVSVPTTASRSASAASGGATPGAGASCKLSKPSLSAWKNDLPADNAELCTVTVVPE